jgi:hypothetical protein
MPAEKEETGLLTKKERPRSNPVVAFAHKFKSARAPSGEKPQYPGFCDKVITLDHLGSVREMTDATGALRVRYDYAPYGSRTKLSGDLDAASASMACIITRPLV